MFIYPAAQAAALSCNFDDAENLSLEALQLSKEYHQLAKIPISSDTAPSIFEVAHFYSDVEKPKKSLQYWEEFFPLWQKFNIPTQDPIGFSLVLAENARTLSAVGNEKNRLKYLLKHEN